MRLRFALMSGMLFNRSLSFLRVPRPLTQRHPVKFATTLAGRYSGEDTRLPVTVLSGFLGAGKVAFCKSNEIKAALIFFFTIYSLRSTLVQTTILNHLLRDRGTSRVAVIVNDMNEVPLFAILGPTGTNFLNYHQYIYSNLGLMFRVHLSRPACLFYLGVGKRSTSTRRWWPGALPWSRARRD